LPVYEYQCVKGHRYEKRESFGAPAEQPCEQPRCNAVARRVLIPPQVHFKGSGWYKTDSRSGSSSTRRAASSSSDGVESETSAPASTPADTSFPDG
jgi:predicted nucleic acid-binding Zn ribbon protein